MTEARFVTASTNGQIAPLSRRELRERERAQETVAQGVPPVPQFEQSAALGAQPNAQPAAFLAADFTTSSGRDFSAPPAATRIVVVRRPAKPRKRIAQQLFSVVAMLFAGAMIVGVSIPANAFMPASSTAALDAPVALAGQSVTVSDVASATEASRADYGVTSYAEMLRKKYGNRSFSYTVGKGAVQWPFPYAVPVTDGFGGRVAPCRGCSTFHQGVDFVPGAGTPIYAIAAGVVAEHEDNNRNSFGNHVLIEHVIGGKAVQSLYGHMQLGSSPLQVGDKVAVGDFIGLVGSTGAATAPHLHLEVHLAGVPVDPFAWLKAHAAK